MEKLDPDALYTEVQLELVEEVEAKHRLKPALFTIVFAIGATLIEGAIAFELLKQESQVLRVFAALFPMTLLWLIANFQSTYVNLPNCRDELKEQYHHELDRENTD
ncbi:hypothetical protein IQ250_28045 [Pseudanabaenaceae cyanobacterium LEGE 13415]|nr:hypothetical protein [Pseudanabaenaceae cyanobacterium LEGE 13415]